MPSRRIVGVFRSIREKKPHGVVVVHGEENDVAEFLDLIAAFPLDADEFFFCHRRLLSVGAVLILYNIIK